MAAHSDDEEDYMTMVIPDVPKAETSLQRRKRRELEAEQRGRNKTKAAKEAEAEAAREAALSTALDSSNKGFKMMAKMGFKQGDTLGKNENARKEPIHLSMKDDRSGIGLESEKRRKFREQAEEAAKRAKLEDEKKENYLEERKREHLEKKLMNQLSNAQKVAETMDEDGKTDNVANDLPAELHVLEDDKPEPVKRPLADIPVVYRGVVRYRRERENEREFRHRNWSEGLSNVVVDEDDEIDKDDAELEEFNALPLEDRLKKVVLYLREKHNYCFWCMYKYRDAEMDGCPGITEEDHD